MGKQTNFDRIKGMNIDEMVEFFFNRVDVGACMDFGFDHKRKCDGKCKKCIKEWLESEVQTDD